MTNVLNIIILTYYYIIYNDIIYDTKIIIFEWLSVYINASYIWIYCSMHTRIS